MAKAFEIVTNALAVAFLAAAATHVLLESTWVELPRIFSLRLDHP
jgi:hypothetical protein